VAQLSPSQVQWRGRIETGLRFAAPFLDLVLAVGDRFSRIVERDDPETLAAGRDEQPVLIHGRR
jgi:hypothetical protein